MEADIHVDTREIERKLSRITRNADAIMAKVSNEAIKAAKKTAVNEVCSIYIVAKKEVNKTITIKKSTGRGSVAGLVSKAYRLDLAKFKVSPMRPVKVLKSKARSPKVYKAQVRKDSSLKALDGGSSGIKPFVAIIKHSKGKDHTGVFQRKDVSRTHKGKYRRGIEREKYTNFVKTKYGPSAAEMMANNEVKAAIEQTINKTLDEQLAKEVGKELSKN